MLSLSLSIATRTQFHEQQKAPAFVANGPLVVTDSDHPSYPMKSATISLSNAESTEELYLYGTFNGFTSNVSTIDLNLHYEVISYYTMYSLNVCLFVA